MFSFSSPTKYELALLSMEEMDRERERERLTLESVENSNTDLSLSPCWYSLLFLHLYVVQDMSARARRSRRESKELFSSSLLLFPKHRSPVASLQDTLPLQPPQALVKHGSCCCSPHRSPPPLRSFYSFPSRPILPRHRRGTSSIQVSVSPNP